MNKRKYCLPAVDEIATASGNSRRLDASGARA
jgi:hypothetical protein